MGGADERTLRRLRRRYWLLFGAAAAVSLFLFGLVSRLIAAPAVDAAERTRSLLVMWLLVLLVLLVSAGAWWLLYRAAFKDVFRFAEELWILAHGDARTRV